MELFTVEGVARSCGAGGADESGMLWGAESPCLSRDGATTASAAVVSGEDRRGMLLRETMTLLRCDVGEEWPRGRYSAREPAKKGDCPGLGRLV